MENTPPVTIPLVHQLGYLANSYEARKVLDGTFIPHPDCNHYAARLLRKMEYIQSTLGSPEMNIKMGGKKSKKTNHQVVNFSTLAIVKPLPKTVSNQVSKLPFCQFLYVQVNPTKHGPKELTVRSKKGK